jgi:predicted nuclease of predicted toxin-antitoxin system
LKFLIDNALSPKVATKLQEAGHDAVHVRDYDMTAADDSAIFKRAADENRVIVSADTDFGTLLALRNSSKPSVILLRIPYLQTAEEQTTLILANLETIENDIEKGCVVIIEPAYIRVRSLPINKSK